MKVQYHIASKDIYQHGFKTPAINKQGFSINHSLPRDGDDRRVVEKGQEYFTWKFRNRERQYSLTAPTQDQLLKYAKPEWNEIIVDFKDRMDRCDEDEKNDLITEVEEYKEELQCRLNNMPIGFQDSSILNERIEELEEILSNLQS